MVFFIDTNYNPVLHHLLAIWTSPNFSNPPSNSFCLYGIKRSVTPLFPHRKSLSYMLITPHRSSPLHSHSHIWWWTFSKRAACLADPDPEDLELTIVVRIACFATSCALVLAFFTSNNNWTNLETMEACVLASYATLFESGNFEVVNKFDHNAYKTASLWHPSPCTPNVDFTQFSMVVTSCNTSRQITLLWFRQLLFATPCSSLANSLSFSCIQPSSSLLRSLLFFCRSLFLSLRKSILF